MIANTGLLSAQRMAPVEQSRQTASALRQEVLPTVPEKAGVVTGGSELPVQAVVRSVEVNVPEFVRGRLQLSVDSNTGLVVGRIVDRESGELLWQVPSEEMLRLIATSADTLEPLFTTEA